MEEFIKTFHPKNKINLYLGCKKSDYFDLNIGNELQEKIVKYIKKHKWIKIINQQNKYYFLEDMKYIITNTGNHKCMKEKIHKIIMNENILLSENQEIQIEVEQFPPISKYDDIRICERTVFYNKKYYIEICNYSHIDNNVTFEIKISCIEQIPKLILELLTKFNYSLDFDNNTKQIIEHGANYVLSIL